MPTHQTKSYTKTFIRAAVHYKTILLGCFFGGIVLSMVSYKLVPKRYKIQCVVGISTQYFQNPLVRDFLPETFDSQEIRAQRDAIIRQALNHKFLESIGNRYKLFGKNKDPKDVTSFDLDQLGRSFEVVPAGPTSFLLGLFSDDPQKGYQIVQEFLNHIRQTLGEERTSTLSRLHDAIRNRLEALSSGEHNAGMNPVLLSRPDLVKAEIGRVQEEISRLKESYSEKHPRVVLLHKRLDELDGYLRLNNSVEKTPARMRAASFSSVRVDPSSKDLFTDLLRKFHYLEVVIFLDQSSQESYLTILQEPFVPQNPVWPKRVIFLVWGAVGGFMVGAFATLFLEVFKNRSWKTWLE